MENRMKRLVPILLTFTMVALAACSSDDNNNPKPFDDPGESSDTGELFEEGELTEQLEAIRANYELPAMAAFVIDSSGRGHGSGW